MSNGIPLPPSSTENPVLGIKHQWVDLPILEEPVRVECLRVGVDVWVAKNCPDVLNHSGPSGDQVSSINIVLHGSAWGGERERWTPSDNLLHQSIDVRQTIFMREIREFSPSNDSIQFLLRFLHCFGVDDHRVEEYLQDRPRLSAVSVGWREASITIPTYRRSRTYSEK